MNLVGGEGLAWGCCRLGLCWVGFEVTPSLVYGAQVVDGIDMHF